MPGPGLDTDHRRWPRCRWLAGAGLLVLAAISPAGAQYLQSPPPPPAGGTFSPPQGQAAAFPPPPSQSQSQSQSFPPPGVQPQSFPAAGAAPQAFPNPSGGPPGGYSQAQQVCGTFKPLADDMEKSLQAVNAAGQRKAPREEACGLFKTLVLKENKAIKFLETNKSLCNVPPAVIKQLQERHAHILKIRNTVCAAGPPPGAAGPTLSDALGSPVIADDTNVKTGRGTFDTLTGNALQR